MTTARSIESWRGVSQFFRPLQGLEVLGGAVRGFAPRLPTFAPFRGSKAFRQFASRATNLRPGRGFERSALTPTLSQMERDMVGRIPSSRLTPLWREAPWRTDLYLLETGGAPGRFAQLVARQVPHLIDRRHSFDFFANSKARSNIRGRQAPHRHAFVIFHLEPVFEVAGVLPGRSDRNLHVPAQQALLLGFLSRFVRVLIDLR